MTKYIKLSQSKTTSIDDKDYEKLSSHKYYAKKDGNTFYAARYEGKTIYMHREIMKAEKGLQVDHIDGDGLNNQRSNLRVCTKKENSRNQKKHKNNTTGYKGVTWHKLSQKYNVKISIDGKRLDLGCFDNILDAAKAYDLAAKKYFKSFANLNFL